MEEVDALYSGLVLYIVLLQLALHPWLTLVLVSLVSESQWVRELRKGFQTLFSLYMLAALSMILFKIDQWTAFICGVGILWFCKKVIDAPKRRYL